MSSCLTLSLSWQNELCTTDSEIVYQMVSEGNTQPNPKEFIQQLSKSGKGRELLEMLEKALKESDPADLEEDAKYTRRDSNPQPSVPKTDALSS